MKILFGKMLLGLCAALVLTLSTGTALAAPDATGSWTGSVQSPNGEFQITFNLKQDGANVSGTLAGGRGGDTAVTGTVSGNGCSHARFTQKVPMAFNASAADGSTAPNSSTQSVQPGQDVLINGTGLGAITSDETQSGVTDVPAATVQVYVGTQPATVVSAGRGLCCDGLDPRFPVIPVRALINDGMRHFNEVQRNVIERFNRGELSQKDAQLEIEHFWAGALRRAVIEGDIESGSLMAGQSVGMVGAEQPTDAILSELIGQAVAALAARNTASN